MNRSPKTTLFVLASIILICGLLARVPADTLVWNDNSGDSEWDTDSGNWRNSTTGDSPVPWSDGNKAYFEQTTGSVNITDTVNPTEIELNHYASRPTLVISGGDITGTGRIYADRDGTTEFHRAGSYSFSGGTYLENNDTVSYMPSVSGNLWFGSEDIHLNGGGADFRFQPTVAGATLQNDFVVDSGNTGKWAPSLTNGASLDGTLTLNGDINATSGMSIPLVLAGGDRTVHGKGHYSRTVTFDSVVDSGGTHSLTLTNTGANPDWVMHLGGPGDWTVHDFTYHAGTNNRANLDIDVADPTAFFSEITGSVVLDGGGTALDSSPTTVDVGFDLRLNASPTDDAKLGTGLISTEQINVLSGGSVGGDGTYAHRDGFGRKTEFPNPTSITVQDGGTVAPGNSAGTMTISGDVLFQDGSILQIEIGGENLGDYDVLDVAGILDIDSGSILELSLIDGYEPESNTTFDILQWNNLADSETFTIQGSLPGGKYWDATDLLTNGQLTAMPEPTTALLLTLATLLILARRRKR